MGVAHAEDDHNRTPSTLTGPYSQTLFEVLCFPERTSVAAELLDVHSIQSYRYCRMIQRLG